MNTKYEKNQLVNVTITDMGENGEGIGRCDGYTLFVKDALIGDEIEALITKAKKNYAYARVSKIINPSADRVIAPCENASRCGGCQIQALSYDAQLRYKENKVKNNLIRLGGFDKEYIDSIFEPIVGADEGRQYRYRNKAQYPVGCDRDGNIIAGFYAGRTHSIIPCEDCLIGIEENKEIVAAVLDYMKNNHIAAYDEKTGKGLVRHILIRKGFTSGQIMVCLVVTRTGKIETIDKIKGESGDNTDCKDKKGSAYVCRLSSLKNQDELIEVLTKITGMTSIYVSINPDDTNVIMGNELHLLWGQPVIKDVIHLRDVKNDFALIEGVEAEFEISPLSFYQVNPYQVEKLYSIALDYADIKDDEELWDVCCGIGTISICAAKYILHNNALDGVSEVAARQAVHGIEIIPEAIEDAKQNARANNVENADFICAAAEEYLPKHADRISADVIILDPPRKGMEEEALRVIADTGAKRIVYVSCDSATLSRDLKYLCENGYQLERVRPVDMFAHSTHVETCVLLSRETYRRPDTRVKIDIDLEDYYRIKEGEVSK